MSTNVNTKTAPGMECTFNDVSDFPSSTGYCNDWPTKRKYPSIAIGNMPEQTLNPNGTGYELLYIDLPLDVLSRPNQIVEGGIRPPSYFKLFSPFL